MSFYVLLTDTGQAKLANAVALGRQVKISQMAVGDANGTQPNPSSNTKALLNERHRAGINRIDVDPQNPNWIVLEQVLPPDVGGWEIREIGAFDEEGNLIAYGNYPPTYKPILSEGSSRTQTLRMVLQVSNAAAVTLKIDPSVVLATRKYVDETSDRLTHDIDAKTKSVKDSLSKIATTGNSADLHGVLSTAQGGTGRSDGNWNSQWVYTSPVNTVGGFAFNDSNKVTAGDDNGEDINKSANVTVDTWYGFAVRTSVNQRWKTSFLHDARSGNTRQRGTLYLTDGDGLVQATSGRMGISCGAGDTLWLNGGNSFSYQNKEGQETLAFQNGRMTVGTVPTERLSDVWSEENFEINDIPAGKGLSSAGVLRRCMGKLANFWGKSLVDISEGKQLSEIKYDGQAIPTAATFATLRDNIDWKYGALANKKVFDMASGSFQDLPWGDNVLVTAGAVKNAFCSAVSCGGIGSYILATYDGPSSVITPGSMIKGSEIYASSSSGWHTYGMERFDGIWRVMCRCGHISQSSGDATGLFLRIS